jgi:formylmethanofuran dehydrogenase subunit E
MMFYTDDPVKDYERYDNHMTERLLRLPVCSECKERIQTEYLYEIDGELICEDCMNDHKKDANDYILEEER